MGLYDCMYLVSKEDLDNKKFGNVEGIGGNVQDSNVNNIEVTNGGTIVIRDSDKGSGTPIKGGDPIRAGETQFYKQRRGLNSRGVSPTYGQNKDISTSLPKGKDRTQPEQLAAPSQVLSDKKLPPNAVRPRAIDYEDVEMEEAPNLHRQAVFNDMKKKTHISDDTKDVEMKDVEVRSKKNGARQGKSERDVVMKDLIDDRLNQLTGGRKRGRERIDDDTKRRMIHDLRDSYNVTRKKKVLTISPPVKRGREEEDSLENEPFAKREKRKHSFFLSPISGKKRERAHTDNDWDSVNKNRRQRSPPPTPPPRPTQRRLTKRQLNRDEREEEDLLDVLDSMGYRPPEVKRRDTHSASVRHVGNIARVKRKFERDIADSEDEEEYESGIPYKSRPISYMEDSD